MKFILLFLVIAAVSAFPQERHIEGQVIVNASVEDVWKAWTTCEGIKTFFAPGCNIELRSGGPYEIFFAPNAESGMRGGDGMIVLAFQENKMLSFTWNAPPSLPEARKQVTHVTIRFEKVDETKTKVTLHHDGWGEAGEWDKAFDYFTHAWNKVVLPRLKYRFEKGPIDWNNPPKLD